MASIDFSHLDNGVGLTILVLAAIVLVTAFRWSTVADAVAATFRPPARGVSIAPSEARWSSTSYANRVALNLVVRVEVENRSDDPWHLAAASVKGHRALAISVRPVSTVPGAPDTLSVAPGATASIGIHCILEAAPPVDPAAPFLARLVLVDQQIRENALRLAARGPKG